jgi:hypothetical protein
LQLANEALFDLLFFDQGKRRTGLQIAGELG